MKSICLIFAIICLTLPARPLQQGKGWRGLVPLHSTRTEVEQLLGPPEQGGDASIYRVHDETVQVEYAKSFCRGNLLGWNVPADTVLQITVIPHKKENLTKLELDKGKYTKAYGHVTEDNYISLDEGRKYEVSSDGNIHTVSYIPSSKDGHLRCPGFPPYDGDATQYRPYDTYGDVTADNEDARLDNIAIELESDHNLKGYIIVYAGQIARPNEATTRADRARQYLISKRHIREQRVIAVDGGYRVNLEVEIYLVPSDLPAPTPTPTFPSTEVHIVKSQRSQRKD